IGCRDVRVSPDELNPYDPGLVDRRDAGSLDGSLDGSADAGCVAAPEVCDERDDDCDDSIDEGFDLTDDPVNCGQCGRICPIDVQHGKSRCASSDCVIMCDASFADCSDPADGCESYLGMPETCGDCDTRCSGAAAFCAPDGAGGFECTADCGGLTDCSGSCVDTTSDVRHCNGCNIPCPDVAPSSRPSCDGGTCGYVCDSGFTDCDGLAANGCESRLRELTSCGACGVPCAPPNATGTCGTGTCAIAACDPGWLDCDGEASNGCEVDGRTSLAHCGGCGRSCDEPANATAECIAGTCTITCDAGTLDCMGDAGCEAVASSPSTCGSCAVSCGGATPLCLPVPGGYTCGASCGGAQMLCGSSCINTQNDPLHCGGCTTVCPSPAHARATCSSSTCGIMCDPGWANCDGDMANGCEVDTRTDAMHCGSCPNACPTAAGATTSCAMGSCRLDCLPGLADCDGAPGCEVDTMNDVASCGGCNQACTLQAHVTSGACQAGSCAITACEAPFADCDGTFANGCEADTSASRYHCGGCGMGCMPPRRCCDSACVPIMMGMCPPP
ncbi:MAG: hypothetical protein AB7P00_02185, partial [Sandaracinaceae bacterium]